MELSTSHSNTKVNSALAANSAISITKLVVLSVTTFGIYEFYWLYKQWKIIQKLKNLTIRPILRALFGPFFAYSLFKHIFSLSKEKGYIGYSSAGVLATGYFILSALWKLTEPYSLITAFSILPLIPVQNALNYFWQKQHPSLEIPTSFTQKEKIIVFLGGSITLLMLYATFFIQ